MENKFNELNEGNPVVVASSRSGAEEVYQTQDGRVWHIRHLKSGRDEVTPDFYPEYLTIRYNPPREAAPVKEFAER